MSDSFSNKTFTIIEKDDYVKKNLAVFISSVLLPFQQLRNQSDYRSKTAYVDSRAAGHRNRP